MEMKEWKYLERYQDPETANASDAPSLLLTDIRADWVWKN